MVEKVKQMIPKVVYMEDWTDELQWTHVQQKQKLGVHEI